MRVVAKGSDLPGWTHFLSIQVPSQDFIRGIDPSYPATVPRRRDGASATFGTKTSSLQAFVAIAKSTTAARAAIRAFHAHSRGPAVAIGAGGYTFQESALSTNYGIAWSSGRYVLGITVNTQGPKPELERPALIALARHMQARIA
jgi:hypothetical protein